MSTFPQVEMPRSADLEGLESLLDLVFSGQSGTGDFSLGPLETSQALDCLRPDSSTMLKSQLDFTYAELQDTKQRLQAANYRLGYLEALLTAREAQLKKAGVRGAWWSQINKLWGPRR